MSFSAGGNKNAVRSDINITPLVDVVLVLLIIFMVMTPILLKQTEVKVPSKPEPTPPGVVVPPSDQVVMKIDKESHTFINNEPVPPEKLYDKVTDVFKNRREKTIFFDVDDQANYGEVLHIMDLCRGAGIKTLGIMTKD
jgi:biopolymer transport protein ExbD